MARKTSFKTVKISVKTMALGQRGQAQLRMQGQVGPAGKEQGDGDGDGAPGWTVTNRRETSWAGGALLNWPNGILADGRSRT